jgi:hypothetical protein
MSTWAWYCGAPRVAAWVGAFDYEIKMGSRPHNCVDRSILGQSFPK